MDAVRPAPSAPLPVVEREPRAWQAAQELEATFLAEMLSAAGLGKARDSFGGGAGEDQFSSFLVREQADAIVSAGGIGLSEAIYRSLVRGGTE